MAFELPVLPYATDALEPHFDKMTMEIHHGKHHNAYVTNLNKALEGHEMSGKSIEEILKNISKLSPAIRNNGGGHYNHSLFWKLLSPTSSGKPSGELASAIDKKFGSFEKFKEDFAAAGVSRFGSGWSWLIVSNGDLAITSTPNQDNPLMDIAEVKGSPILALDVWEHAYYLKYQNRRPDYIASFWNIVNWSEVEKLYASSK
ncbi:MAG: superoxide dismutase [Cytophagales bacterium]|nr:MAG: superoxide dismutase [Cytophagales bacterium]